MRRLPRQTKRPFTSLRFGLPARNVAGAMKKAMSSAEARNNDEKRVAKKTGPGQTATAASRPNTALDSIFRWAARVSGRSE
jgi:hypothetical protein